MTHSFTFPESWRVRLDGIALMSPVRSGSHLLVADKSTLRALRRTDGAEAWSERFGGNITQVIAVDRGCVIVVSEPTDHRVAMVDHRGDTVWDAAGWSVARQGMRANGDRFLLSGAQPDRPKD